MSIICSALRKLFGSLWKLLGKGQSHILDLIIPILIVAVCVESVLLYRQHDAVVAAKEKAAQLERTISNQAKPAKQVAVKTDKGTITASVAEPVKMTKENIEATKPQATKIAKAVGARPKDIDEITTVVPVTHDTVFVPLIKEPPDGGLAIRYRDDYASINVDIDNVDSAETARVDYTFIDSIVITSFQRRHSIFFGLIKWKSTEKVEAHSLNPKTTLQTLEVVQKIE